MSSKPSPDFTGSATWHARASQCIPLASQTFSKSSYTYPFGASPQFAAHANGSTLVDIDGNTYLDFVSGLLCISLGYADPDVNQAVKSQLDDGSIYSLPHQLETEVAERLIQYIPCAEMVRFGKNGSDATSAAIRLARAFTGRDHILVCGYHGWHDWYIGTTVRDLGVPQATQALSHTFPYNDINAVSQLFDTYHSKVAAIIMEPMNLEWPIDGYLQSIRTLCDQHQALLIFDETITGFRFHMGGAQSFFDVTPDLATFGKGMANGFPLSAIVGKKHLMSMMEDIFFSGTFGGDTIALAAAKATIDKLVSSKALAHIQQIGEYLIEQLNALIISNHLSSLFQVKGHPSWSFLSIQEGNNYPMMTIKTYILQELCSRGILSNGSHNLMYAHTKSDIENLLNAYQEILPLAYQHDQNQTLLDALHCAPLEPVFQVRG